MAGYETLGGFKGLETAILETVVSFHCQTANNSELGRTKVPVKVETEI